MTVDDRDEHPVEPRGALRAPGLRVLGIRFGAHVPWSFVLSNFFLAAAGNMVGGIGLVTLNRFTQARSGATSASG